MWVGWLLCPQNVLVVSLNGAFQLYECWWVLAPSPGERCSGNGLEWARTNFMVTVRRIAVKPDMFFSTYCFCPSSFMKCGPSGHGICKGSAFFLLGSAFQAAFLNRANSNKRVFEIASNTAYPDLSDTRSVKRVSDFHKQRKAKLLGHIMRA